MSYNTFTESLYPSTYISLFPLNSQTLATTTLLICAISSHFLRFHISDTIQYLFIFVWIILLSIMPSKFIHVVSNLKINVFLRVNDILLCLWMFMYYIFSIYSFIDINLVVSISCLLWIMLSELESTNIYWFHFLWIYIQK